MLSLQPCVPDFSGHSQSILLYQRPKQAQLKVLSVLLVLLDMMGMCVTSMTQLRNSHLLRYNYRVSTTVGVQDLSQVYVFLGYSWVELNVTGHSDRDRTKSHCSFGFCFFEKSPGEELRHPRWDSDAKKGKLVQLVRPQASDGAFHNGPAQHSCMGCHSHGLQPWRHAACNLHNQTQWPGLDWTRRLPLSLYFFPVYVHNFYRVNFQAWKSTCLPSWAAQTVLVGLLEDTILHAFRNCEQVLDANDSVSRNDGLSRLLLRGIPGDSVVKNPPCNAGDTGLIPGLRGSHMPWSSWAHLPQLLHPCSRAQEPQLLSPCATTAEALHLEPVLYSKGGHCTRSPRTQWEGGPCSSQLEKQPARPWRASIAKNK